MANPTGTLETLALEVGHALEPLKDLLGPNVFGQLGLPLPRAISSDAPLLAALEAARQKATDLPARITALAGSIGANSTASIISNGILLTDTIAELVASLVQAGNALDAAANTLSAAEKAAFKDLAAAFAVRVIEAMGVTYLSERLPSLTSAMAALGLLDIAPRRGPGMEVSYAPRDPRPPRLHLDRIPQLLQHPDQYFQQLFRWGDPAFNGSELFSRIQALLESLGLSAAIYPGAGGRPVLEAYVLSAQSDPSVNPPGLGIDLVLPGQIPLNHTTVFSPLWKGTVSGQAQFAAGLHLGLRPPFQWTAQPPTGNVALDLALGLKAEGTTDAPVPLLSLTGGTHLTARSLGGSVGIKAALGTAGGSFEPSVQLRLDDGLLVIDFSEGDGFIQQLLAGVHLEATFGLIADWSPSTGLRLQGQGGVEVFLPVHIDLAVLIVNGLYLSIGFGGPAPLSIGLATQLTSHIGPLVAVVDQMGVRADISFPAGGAGRLGLADIDFAFLPPKGVGLSIDAGVVKGGGFLRLDFDKGEYFGALELTFSGIIALKAVGIINTKMPDGRPGFALLILITAEFTPIQLGFGFTLNGVGGLLGANRTASLEALQSGVRTGALSSVLFPQDVVGNITRIVSDLQAIFPIAQDHFLIGPMAKLGWGTPTLISLELGVILDIPTPRIIILGVLRCILPAEEAAILKLQVAFAGGIDFDRGLIWFDASLFDSSLLIYTLSGDMALRIGWKEPLFVLSVGGFHPAFKEVPSDLTTMQRMTVALLSGNNPRLTTQTYFAVTSNTVQNGARVELYAEACGFNVYGYLGYDLLVQFNPFHFIAEIAAGLALREGSHEIAGIHARCQLSGPTPWHAEGEATLTILFFDISVGFNETWGETGPSIGQEVEDVLKLVKTALDDKRNWIAETPPNATQGVTMRKIEIADGDLFLHPFGVLAVSQKVVPLGLPIDKFGLKKPLADTLFELTSPDAGTEEVREEFALASFKQLSDSDKLSRKSFERMRSGLRFTPLNTTAHGQEIGKDVDYELSYVHRARGLTLKGGLIKLFTGLYTTLLGGTAAATHTNAVARRTAACAPAKVDIQGPRFSVVSVDDLTLHAPGLTAASEAEALVLHDSVVAADPTLRGRLQVVAEHELA